MWMGIGIKIVARALAAPAAGPFGNHASLLDGLVAYWTLDEASGVREDSVGTNDLTDNNTVGSASGKNNLAGSFVAANTEYLSHSDEASLKLSASQTFSLWFNSSTNAVMTMVSKDDGGSQREYNILLLNGAIYTEHYWDAQVILTFGSGLNDGAWHHLLVWVDETDPKIRARLDGGATQTSAGTLATAPAVSIVEFRLGRLGDGSFSYDGLLDEVGKWNRVLTAQEQADLYNSGNGLFYGS